MWSCCWLTPLLFSLDLDLYSESESDYLGADCFPTLCYSPIQGMTKQYDLNHILVCFHLESDDFTDLSFIDRYWLLLQLSNIWSGTLPNVQQSTMAHRLSKKVLKTNVNGQHPQNQMDHFHSARSHAKLPRPLIPSVDSIYVHDKSSFRKQMLAFPPAQSLFVSENVYDAGPEFVRPTSAFMLGNPKKTQFPFGAWITPFGSEKVHTVRVKNPLRCTRCKAYVNPYFRFDGAKTSAICNICGINFAVEAFVDPNNLNSPQISTEGIVDFVVSDKMFMRKRLDIIKVIIVIQLCHYMSENGIISTIVESLKSVIQNHEFQSNVRIGIVFFNSQGITFLKLKNHEQWADSPPRKFHVKYSSGMCCPLSDSSMLYDPNSQKQQLVYLIDHLYELSEDFYKNSNYAQYAANYASTIKSVVQAFEKETGRILLFSHTTPRAGPYAIGPKNNEDNKNPLKSLGNEYFQLSRELVKSKLGVDMFMFTKQPLVSQQLCTVHYLCSLTGGSLELYCPYKSQIHGQNLYYEIYSNLSRKYVYDVDFTARVSNGLNIASFGAGDGIRESRDVTLSMVDPSHSFVFTFEHEDKIHENSAAYLQFAMMFTTGSGERRVRIINYRYQITNRIQDLHAACDYLAVANILLRQAMTKMLKNDLIKAREEVVNRLVSIIAEFAQDGACKMRNSDLMAHPHFGPALAYIHSVVNSRIFLNPQKTSSDFKIYEMLRINTLNFYAFANYYYPKLYSLGMEIYEEEPVPGDLIEGDERIEQSAVLPPNLPLCHQSMDNSGVYLFSNPEYLIILVMSGAPEDLLVQIFGTDNWEEIENNDLQELQTPHNIRINIMIEEIRRRNTANNGKFTPLIVHTPIRKGPFSELVSTCAKQDYPDCKYFNFLDEIHRNVQTRLK